MPAIRLETASGTHKGKAIGWRVVPLDKETCDVIAGLTDYLEVPTLPSAGIVLPAGAPSTTAGMVAGNVLQAASGGPNAVGPLLSLAWGKSP